MRIVPRTVVLDAQGLSLLVDRDEAMTAFLLAARRAETPVVVSPVTIVEAVHRGTDRSRLDWLLSRLVVEPVTEPDARAAVRLLHEAGGLHGHTHAIDALVAALALRLPAPVVVVTSDPDDWNRLVGDRVRVHRV
ncbi:MAG: PIN domain-containing protein [Micrococcales bacterium]|nr:PIN domain-containing protein [Micrococcales bacterium]